LNVLLSASPACVLKNFNRPASWASVSIASILPLNRRASALTCTRKFEREATHRVPSSESDQYGGWINAPRLTEIVDSALFAAFTAASLKNGDARHLMYAVHNDCDRFVTLDEDFLGARRTVLEQSTRGLRIVRPTELATELGC
jgi:hypothetical protein